MLVLCPQISYLSLLKKRYHYAKSFFKKKKKRRRRRIHQKDFGFSTSCNLNLSLSDTRSVNDIIIIHYSLVPLSTLFFSFTVVAQSFFFSRFFYVWQYQQQYCPFIFIIYLFRMNTQCVFFHTNMEKGLLEKLFRSYSFVCFSPTLFPFTNVPAPT